MPHSFLSAPWQRREFLKATTAISGLSLFDPFLMLNANPDPKKSILIKSVDVNFEREPLIRPFGFKGGYLSEIWQSVVGITSENNTAEFGIGTQNILWSDANVFSSHSESGGNALMYALTERAAQIIKGNSFTDPITLLDNILEEVYAYGKKITGCADLRKTFALNALVAVDNAAWLTYAAENNIKNFDDLIPEQYKPALSHHHQYVASVPSMAYTIPMQEMKDTVADGYFVLKIKLGMPGTQQEMLKQDMERFSAIHHAIGATKTKHTKNGKIPYYLDANGRYEKKETLLKFLDHAEKIGALEQIIIFEEPFPEEVLEDVSDVPVLIAADESAHTDADAIKRIELGYKGIALKAIAKTLSMTMKIAQAAHERNIPCFCADLTVNPILVDWNKNVAARLAPFPGLDFNLMETNGHQNYKYWDKMKSYHPYPNSPWLTTQNGVFHITEDFYDKSGGIFTLSSHYQKLLNLK